MTDADKELERLAKAAEDEAPNPGHEKCQPPAIAAFQRAANPQAVQALIERVRELEAQTQWARAGQAADQERAERLANENGTLKERVRELEAERKGTVRLTAEELRDIQGALAHVYDPGFLTPELMDHAKLRDKVAVMVEAKIKEVRGE